MLLNPRQVFDLRTLQNEPEAALLTQMFESSAGQERGDAAHGAVCVRDNADHF
jgi:hypothetical protein